MSTVKIVVGPELHRPVIIFMAGNSPIDVFHLKDIRECIGCISGKLIGVVRATRFGTAWPEMAIPFKHRGGPTTLELTILPTLVGADAEIEFREYPVASVYGWRDPKYAEYKLLHASAMSPQQVADLLYGVLNHLVRDRLADIYDSDPTLLKMALEAMEIYNREAKDFEWKPATVTQWSPASVAESGTCAALH